MKAVQTLTPAISTLSYAMDQAQSLKDKSWNKANEVLSSHYGTAAIHTIDNTAETVDKFIDKYFPPIEKEEEILKGNLILFFQIHLYK